MSQTKNKVEWCLNKAKRENAEGKKHRGLIKVEPNLEEAKKHLKKAEHNLKAIISFEKTGFSDWSASAGFYCIYHCFLAILAKQGYESRNQECTVALMKVLKEERKTNMSDEIIETTESIDEKEKHENNVIEMRENFQYGTSISIEDKKIAKLKDLCKESYELAQNEVGRGSFKNSQKT